MSEDQFSTDCSISEVQAHPQPCGEDGNFHVILDFNYLNVGDLGFRVAGNGNNYGNFNYEDVPVTIGPLEGDGVTIYEFVVIDNQFEDCSAWTAIDPVNCNPSICDIWDVEAVPQPCNDDGYFMVALDFEYVNVGEMGFRVNGNGHHYGNFAYENLPVMIGPLLGDGTTVYEFGVTDIQYEDCTDWTEIDPVDCNTTYCQIWEVDAEVLPCNEAGDFFVELDFLYQNVGAHGFRVQGSGYNHGNFEYADLPVTIGPLPGDGVTVYEFVVIDNQFEDCSNWTAIDPVDCDGVGNQCHIYDLVVDDHPCVEGMFSVYLNFQYQDVSEEGFRIVVNDLVLGEYSYEDLPLTNLGPFEGDGTTVYEFHVFDLVYDNCGDVAALGPIHCGGSGNCWISELNLDQTDCEEGMFYYWLNFEYQNVSNEGFEVIVNDALFGTFGYGDLPVQIGPLPGDGVTSHIFLVRDLVHQDCGSDAARDPVNCDGGGEECEIEDLEITVLPCNDEGFFNVLLDFEYENIGDLGFHVQGNGTHYGDYYYEHLPVEIGPLEGDGTTVYEFLVFDNQFQDCGESDWIDPVSCGDSPQLDNLSLDVASCSSGEFYLSLDFKPVNMNSDTFSLYVNGVLYHKYLFDDLPMTVGPWPANGQTDYNFVIRESGLERYGDWEKLWAFTCETLSITENSRLEPTVKPNPTMGEITVDIGHDKQARVNIYDLTGKSVMEKSFIGKTTAELTGNPYGMYIVRIAVGEQVYIRKLIYR